MREDFTVGMEQLSRWQRIAVVTDVKWINLAVRTFSFLMPGKVRVSIAGEIILAVSTVLGIRGLTASEVRSDMKLA